MSATMTDLRERAEKARQARDRVNEEKRRAAILVQRERNLEVLRREAAAQLGEHIYTEDCPAVFDEEDNPLIVLGDGLTLFYVPSSYGTGGEFYLAEYGPDGVLDYGHVRIGGRNVGPVEALADLGEALAQGVSHPQDDAGEGELVQPMRIPSEHDRFRAWIARAEAVAEAHGTGQYPGELAAQIAVARGLDLIYEALDRGGEQ